MKTGEKIALGVGVGVGLAVVGVGALFKRSSDAKKAARPTGASYKGLAAQVDLIDKGAPNVVGVTAYVGTNIRAGNIDSYEWDQPGVITSDATVLAPEVPAWSPPDGFVAISPGTAMLSANYTDAQGVYHQQQIVVTVLESP